MIGSPLTEAVSDQSAIRLKFIRLFEKVMLAFGILGPCSTIPQIVKLYHTHSHHAEGFSLTTWSMYLLLSALWLTYGILTKLPAIYVSNGLYTAANLIMVIGIIIHAGFTF